MENLIIFINNNYIAIKIGVKKLKIENLSLFLVFVMICMTPAFAESISTDETTEKSQNTSSKLSLGDTTNTTINNTNNITKNNFTNIDSTIYVDNNNGNDNNTGTIDKPKKTVQEALKVVKENGQIILAIGQYQENNITINKSVTINGQNAEIINTQLIIDNKSVEITDLTFKQGDYEQGGTINNKGSLSLENCQFQDNHAVLGGAIYNIGTLNINKCIFNNNAADKTNESYGGAIFNKIGKIKITNSKFTNNKAIKEGGAINNNLKSDLTLKDTVFINNQAMIGGAIYNGRDCQIDSCSFESNSVNGMAGSIYSSGILSIDNSKFTKNEAIYGEGGAIIAYNSSTINNTLFDNNRAKSSGAISNNGNITIINNKFNQNFAFSNGGAIISMKGKLTVQKSEFNENIADKAGGAILNCEPSTGTIEENKFTKNKAFQGGAIHNMGPCIIKNNQFIENTAHDAGAIYNTFQGTLTSPLVDIENNNFIKNGATQSGGAIINLGMGKLSNNNFTMNKISSNNGTGGGILNINGTLYINDFNYFYHNAVNCIGGGIANIDLGHIIINGLHTIFQDSSFYNSGYLDIMNCTIYFNTNELNDTFYNDHQNGFRLIDTIILPSNHDHRYVKVDLGPFRDSVYYFLPTHMDPIGNQTLKQGETCEIIANLWTENWVWLLFTLKLEKLWDWPACNYPIKFRVYNKDRVYIDSTISTGTDGYARLKFDTSKLPPGEYVVLSSYDGHSSDSGSAYQYSYITILPK